MGMYTQMKLDVRLKLETPDAVIQAIDLMVNGLEVTDEAYYDLLAPSIKNDPLFQTERWTWMLRSEIAGFEGDHYLLWQQENGIWHLDFLSMIKNYTGEWEALIEFLRLWVAGIGNAGSLWYEEDKYPTNIYFT